ncbi:unnamed protein product [Durusdinium trenchii]|uniref:ATPase AAA-type core domain-containing protein n=1 Tax=Durusdinium trenchii TaxID=1381693 RepID=A0ABP0NU05_9DINO
MGAGASTDRETRDAFKRIVYTAAATPRGASESASLSIILQPLGGEPMTVSCKSCSAVEELRNLVPLEDVCGLIFKGRLLAGSSKLHEEGIQTGDLLTACLGKVKKLQAIRKTQAWASDSFALLRSDGSVSTWGEPQEGGNSSPVQEDLKNVIDISGSQSAFTALRGDGQIVTWGHKDYGAALGGHKEELTAVTGISASGRAFAAVLKDATVVAWGDKKYGGDCQTVKEELQNVKLVVAAFCAFAALCKDGRVVSWGNEAFGGSSESVKEKLVNVRHLAATDGAFAALKDDGTVVAWGDESHGGRCPSDLQNVQEIVGTTKAFAARLRDGSVRVWGDPVKGGCLEGEVQERLKEVQRLFASGRSFAALLATGTVLSWGEVSDTRGVEEELQDVRTVAASYGAFAALRGDGHVVSWGDRNYGADTSRFKADLNNIQIIEGASEGFAAIRADGKIVCWDRIGQVDVKADSLAAEAAQASDKKCLSQIRCRTKASDSRRAAWPGGVAWRRHGALFSSSACDDGAWQRRPGAPSVLMGAADAVAVPAAGQADVETWKVKPRSPAPEICSCLQKALQPLPGHRVRNIAVVAGPHTAEAISWLSAIAEGRVAVFSAASLLQVGGDLRGVRRWLLAQCAEDDVVIVLLRPTEWFSAEAGKNDLAGLLRQVEDRCEWSRSEAGRLTFVSVLSAQPVLSAWRSAFQEVVPLEHELSTASVPLPSPSSYLSNPSSSTKTGLEHLAPSPAKEWLLQTAKGSHGTPCCVVIVGPRGSGKSTFLAALKSLPMKVLPMFVPALINAGIGDTHAAVRKHFERAHLHQPSCITLDDVDELFGNEDKDCWNHGISDLLAELVHMLDQFCSSRLLFIATSSRSWDRLPPVLACRGGASVLAKWARRV